MGISMEYSWLILGVIICGFIVVSVMMQALNKNPAE